MMKVTLVMAMTADGRIAKNENHPAAWTSRADKKLFVEITKDCGVVMMGENTFKTLRAPLSDRLNLVFTEDPDRTAPAGVEFVSGDPEPVLADLERRGYRQAILAGGAQLNSLFLEKGLISEICLTVEPKIFGAGLGIFSRPWEADLELAGVEKLEGGAIVLRYAVSRNL